MTKTTIFHSTHKPSENQKSNILNFLYTHLEEYGDDIRDIEKAFDYSLGANQAPGGLVAVCTEKDEIVSAAVVNKTGMKGYIPENILVYIATHNQHRGKGIGKTLMTEIIEAVEGDLALHVEPDNPALYLYKKLGFTSKYLEMRLHKPKQ